MAEMVIVDPALQQKLQRYLSANEKLLWVGRPGQGIRFEKGDIFQTVFAIFWLGFVLWTPLKNWSELNYTMFSHGFLLPFVAIGFYMLIGRFFYDAYVRSRQVYGLTSLRLMVAVGDQCTSSALNNLPQLTLSYHLQGWGTINFSPTIKDGEGGTSSGPASGTSFKLIKDAQLVFEMITRQQNKRAR
jgi:hypothetical protein